MGISLCYSPPVSSCRLPLTFAADDLACDLTGIAGDAWVAHFNAGYHDGGCSGVTLRGIGGDARQLFPGQARSTSYLDTPLLACCPRIGSARARLHCPVFPFSAADDAVPIPADGPEEAAVVAFMDQPY